MVSRSLGPVFSALTPIVGSVGSALTGLEFQAQAAINGPGFTGLTTWIAKTAPTAIVTLGDAVGKFGSGLATMFERATPLEQQMEQGILHLADDFDRFASGNGFANFMTFVEQNAPKVSSLISSLAGVGGQALIGFAEWGSVLLTVGDPLLKLLDTLLQVNPGLAEAATAAIGVAVAYEKLRGPITDAISAFQTVSNFGSKLYSTFLDSSAGATGLGDAASRAGAEVATLGGEADAAGAEVEGLGTESEVAAGQLSLFGNAVSTAGIRVGAGGLGADAAEGADAAVRAGTESRARLHCSGLCRVAYRGHDRRHPLSQLHHEGVPDPARPADRQGLG